MLRRILVPIDFSELSRHALDYALPLASLFRAQLTLVHVVEPAVFPLEPGPAVLAQGNSERDMAKRLHAFAQEFVPEDFIERTLVRRGSADQEIVAAARRCKADLIVLTTHGYRGLKRAILGSTTERVVRHAPCPVLTVGQE